MKKRIYLLCEPKHANLGDQAQLMCTLKWVNENYPAYKVVRLGTMFGAFDYTIKSRLQTFTRLLKFLYLKMTIRHDDIFVGHSGYFFIDHHIGWLTYAFFMRYFPKHKMIILPQTINFYSPVAKQMAVDVFGSKPNLTLLCRDEVSFDNAKKMFGKTKLLLFPDIVTSLIGTMHFNNKREGILLCARNDVEAFYTKDELMNFLSRFKCKRKEITDTTISVSQKEMAKKRNQLILEKIKYFSTFQIVITDRYHGTIFSAIASTPVIVINSADHKLSSGVKWFPEDVFGDKVQFADNLDEAFNMATDILSRNNQKYNNPPYFKEKYWDKLKEIIDIHA
jgi:exopolysaccharide biosynthesis predicted pyruvyltransferase EpsI